MTILNVRDANTGKFLAVDLSNPSGTLYVNDENTGGIIPVVLGSSGTPISFASNAEAAAKSVTNKALSPSNLATSGVLPKSLTDYANTVVVDSGGNGDYTTIGAAMTAITDATITKRYTILVFGAVSETSIITAKDYVDIIGLNGHTVTFVNASHYIDGATATYSNLRITNGAIRVQSGKTSVLELCKCAIALNTNGTLETNGCSLIQISVLSAATGGTLNLYNTQCVRSGAFASFSVAFTFRARNCRIYTSGNVAGLFFNEACTVEIDNSYIGNPNGTSSPAIGFGVDQVAVRITHSTIESGSNAVSPAFYTGVPQTNFIAVDTLFKAETGTAASCDVAWSNARFMHCQFLGALTSITCLSGTAQGSSVSF